MMKKKSIEREKKKNESAIAKAKADKSDFAKTATGEEENWQEKAQEYLDGWKRSQADFENYRKRQAEEKKDLIAYGNINLILDILPVIDNFYASTGHIPEDQKDSPWVTGIMHIRKQLEQVLADKGVSEIPVKSGDEFDPEIHEAIEDKSDKKTEELKNIVKTVVQKGYKMDSRIIRPARVIVE